MCSTLSLSMYGVYPIFISHFGSNLLMAALVSSLTKSPVPACVSSPGVVTLLASLGCIGTLPWMPQSAGA